MPPRFRSLLPVLQTRRTSPYVVDGTKETELKGETAFSFTPGSDEYQKKVFVRAIQKSPIANENGSDGLGIIRDSNKADIIRGKGYQVATPVLVAKGVKFMTIQAKTGEEYLIVKPVEGKEDALTGTWKRLTDKEIEEGKDSLTFTGLDEDTEYHIYARLYETEAYDAGDPSEPLKERTELLLTGVKIQGEAHVFGELTAIAEPEEVKILTYQWYKDGKPIQDATEQTYVLMLIDVGCKITVKATQVIEGDQAVTKEATVGPIDKAPGEDSEIPELEAKKTTWITIITHDDEEYSIDGGKTWQTSGTFTGLKPNTKYQIIARKKETDFRYPGAPSEPLEVTTDDVGKVEAKLELGKDTPEMTMGELKTEMILKIAEAAAAGAADRRNDGENILLTVIVTNIDKTVSAVDRRLVRDTLKKKSSAAKDLLYLDISVYLTIGSDEPIQLTDLGKIEIGLTLTVPEKFKAASGITRTFHIVRTHAGSGVILASSQKTEIPFKSSLFSAYALGATDEPEPTPTPTVTLTPAPSPSQTPSPTPTTKPSDTKGVNTGDDSNMPLWITLLGMLIAGMIVFNVYRRKRR